MSAIPRIAYLVNSTPKYFYLLPLHFQLLRRYGGPQARSLHLFFATEQPEHPICQRLVAEFSVEILPLPSSEAGFLDSRRAALRMLQERGGFSFVLPVQEDFLVDRQPGWSDIEMAAAVMDADSAIVSMRLMPCPGPQRGEGSENAWVTLKEGADFYGFTFQATLWRLGAALDWYEAICGELERKWPAARTKPADRVFAEVRLNLAENADGQQLFWRLSAERGWSHGAWKRVGPWSNAVYLCPWPYRPTAIVKGVLEPWAAEMARREGYPEAAGGATGR